MWRASRRPRCNACGPPETVRGELHAESGGRHVRRDRGRGTLRRLSDSHVARARGLPCFCWWTARSFPATRSRFITSISPALRGWSGGGYSTRSKLRTVHRFGRSGSTSARSRWLPPRPRQTAWPTATPRAVLDKILVDAAVASGAELRERFSVEEVVMDGDRVTGIRGRVAGGKSVVEKARIVVAGRRRPLPRGEVGPGARVRGQAVAHLRVLQLLERRASRRRRALSAAGPDDRRRCNQRRADTRDRVLAEEPLPRDS
jgi:hypothetical protein